MRTTQESAARVCVVQLRRVCGPGIMVNVRVCVGASGVRNRPECRGRGHGECWGNRCVESVNRANYPLVGPFCYNLQPTHEPTIQIFVEKSLTRTAVG